MRELLSALRERVASGWAVSVFALLVSPAALSLALWAAYQILSTRQDVWLSYSTQANSGAASAVILGAFGAALVLFVAAHGVRKRRS